MRGTIPLRVNAREPRNHPATIAAPSPEPSRPERPRQRRFNVTHGIWGAEDDVRGTEVLKEGPDETLDRLMCQSLKDEQRRWWRLVKYPNPPLSATVVLRTQVVPNWGQLYSRLSAIDAQSEAWFVAEDFPGELQRPGAGPPASAATLQGWDGRTGLVEHNGWCVLLITRAHYPGWFYQINGGPARPVSKANGGLQAIALVGEGPSRVQLFYRPTGLKQALALSLTALAAALLVLAGARIPWPRAFGDKPSTQSRGLPD